MSLSATLGLASSCDVQALTLIAGIWAGLLLGLLNSHQGNPQSM
jgi:hypothetical protein